MTRSLFLVPLCAVVAVGLASAQTPRAAADPLTIDQAVSEALDHNLSLLAERFNVTVAAASVVTAGLRPNPVITVNAMLPDRELVDAGVSTRDGVVRTDYVVERGGKRERRVDQAVLAR